MKINTNQTRFIGVNQAKNMIWFTLRNKSKQ